MSTSLGDWQYFTRGAQGVISYYEPEGPQDFHYRLRDAGYRVQLQWYDDGTLEWIDRGLYKSRTDIIEELSL